VLDATPVVLPTPQNMSCVGKTEKSAVVHEVLVALGEAAEDMRDILGEVEVRFEGWITGVVVRKVMHEGCSRTYIGYSRRYCSSLTASTNVLLFTAMYR